VTIKRQLHEVHELYNFFAIRQNSD
jgi:hypothetical protein